MVLLKTLLNKHIDKCYKKYDTVDLRVLDKLKESYYSSRTTEKTLYPYPLVLFIIKNSMLHIEAQLNDDRVLHIYQLIKKALNWAVKKNKQIPNTTLYFWISDRIPWYDNIDEKFPIYVFAKPKNTNFIVFPDNTFECMTMDEKYNGVCYDWDETAKIIMKKSAEIQMKDKINQIFFKGTSTTKRNSKIRENLHEYSKNGEWLFINLDGWYAYVSMENFCKYKFLINLPGHYPWSNRLKYLFLMKSVIINVDVYSIDTQNNITEPPWISFINLITKPKKHYINLKLKYHYSANKEEKDKNLKLNNNECIKIYNKLEKIYNSDTNKYQEMINKGYKRVSKLKNRHVYEYIYDCILRNSLVKFI